MLIFVSDLHLADHPYRGSFDAEAFLTEVDTHLRRSSTQDPCTLVLLGDIFELLKAGAWLGSEHRPWHAHSPALEDLVADILKTIHDNNRLFFDGLSALKSNGLRLVYVPGNHDGLLASTSGAKARALLRSYLELEGGDAAFESALDDADHGVHAQHGHEFDAFNHPTATQPRFVPGDVVVIELLCALPHETAKALDLADPGKDQFQESLRFLHEVDNVLPQDAAGILAWIQFGIERAPAAEREKVRAAVVAALGVCLDHARKQARRHGELSNSLSLFTKLVAKFVSAKGTSAVSRFAAFEPRRGTEVVAVGGSARALAVPQRRGRQETFLFVAGHTHCALHRPLPIGDGRVMTYLNSGTWRRVYLCVADDEQIGFCTFNEETMLVVQRRIDAQPPSYDFRRQIRGL